jgi:hypothetical protein
LSVNAFLDRDKKKGTYSHRRAPKQEKELALRVGGKRTSGSGNKMEKGDIRLKKIVRIEAKTTKNKSFSVTEEMLDKIEHAALSTGEMPVIFIEFNDGIGNKKREICVCPSYVIDLLSNNG